MPFHRMKSPVKTEKHEQTWTALSEDASVNKAINLITGVDVGAKVGITDVAIGAHVKWIFCEFQFAAETITNAKTVHWCIRVIPPTATASGASALNAADKSYVIKRGLEMLPKDLAVVYKRVFTVNIPKLYQRVKEGQKINFEYKASSTQTINSCGLFIYKEIY